MLKQSAIAYMNSQIETKISRIQLPLASNQESSDKWTTCDDGSRHTDDVTLEIDENCLPKGLGIQKKLIIDGEQLVSSSARDQNNKKYALPKSKLALNCLRFENTTEIISKDSNFGAYVQQNMITTMSKSNQWQNQSAKNHQKNLGTSRWIRPMNSTMHRVDNIVEECENKQHQSTENKILLPIRKRILLNDLQIDDDYSPNKANSKCQVLKTAFSKMFQKQMKTQSGLTDKETLKYPKAINLTLMEETAHNNISTDVTVYNSTLKQSPVQNYNKFINITVIKQQRSAMIQKKGINDHINKNRYQRLYAKQQYNSSLISSQSTPKLKPEASTHRNFHPSPVSRFNVPSNSIHPSVGTYDYDMSPVSKKIVWDVEMRGKRQELVGQFPAPTCAPNPHPSPSHKSLSASYYSSMNSSPSTAPIGLLPSRHPAGTKAKNSPAIIGLPYTLKELDGIYKQAMNKYHIEEDKLGRVGFR